MKWIIDGTEYTELEEATEAILDEIPEDDYNDWIDEVYPEIEIGCCRFYASEILKELDPIAYDCGMDDFKESIRESIQDELYGMDELPISN